MPENNERNKGKTELFFRQECACPDAGAEHQLPLFESDTSSAERLRLGAMIKVASNIRTDVSNGERLDNASRTQKTTTTVNNLTQDCLDRNRKESCFSQDVSSIQLEEDKDLNLESVCLSKTALDGDEEILDRVQRVVSVEKGLRSGKFSTEKDDSSETQFENGSPKQNVSLAIEKWKTEVIEQEASQIVDETLRLMNEALQLENELPELEGNASSCVNKQAVLKLTKLDISETEKAELNLTQDTSYPSLKTPRYTTTEQNAADDICEINLILHDTPLIFPETSNVEISIPKESSSGKKEKSHYRRNTPCLSDIEPGITRDTADIRQTDLIDSWKGNPSESSLAGANTQQFHIMVRTHPDGGWGWVVCLGAFLVQFIVLGMQNTAGIVYTELVKELKSPRGATAWVGSLATGIMFFLGPLTTSLCERLGCRIVTICGGLICITGLLLSSMVSSLLPLYFTYGVMFGSGTSLCYFPTIIVLSKYFKRRIAVVNGLVTAGSGVGTLVIGPVVQVLFLRFGVADTFRIVAGIFILVLLCGATFRPVPAKYSQYHGRTTGGGARRLFDWSIFKNRGYVIWVASLATFQLGYFVPFVHLVRHAEDLGVTPTDASFLIGYLSVASTVGRLFFGKMADLSCVNRIRMYQLGVFAIGLCSFLVPLATGYVGLTAYAITFGFFEACYVLLIPLVTNDIVGADKMSYALGSAFTVMAFPMFIGPPIAGWMYDVFGDYAGAFYACGGISLIAAFFMFFIPRWSTKGKEDSDLKLRQLLNRKNTGSHSKLLRILFGCLWKKELPESKTLSNVQYSVILTTEGNENV